MAGMVFYCRCFNYVAPHLLIIQKYVFKKSSADHKNHAGSGCNSHNGFGGDNDFAA